MHTDLSKDMDALVYVNGAIYRPPSRLMLRTRSEPVRRDSTTNPSEDVDAQSVEAMTCKSSGAEDAEVSQLPSPIPVHHQQGSRAADGRIYKKVEDLLGGQC